MLKFYYSLAPNPMKVALFLEEAGLPYEAIPVDTRKGEQHLPAFTALNANAKVPVIVDGATTVFDSAAILLFRWELPGFMPTASNCSCSGAPRRNAYGLTVAADRIWQGRRIRCRT